MKPEFQKDTRTPNDNMLYALQVISQVLSHSENIEEIFHTSANQISNTLPIKNILFLSVDLAKRKVINYFEYGNQHPQTGFHPSFDDFIDTPLGLTLLEWHSVLSSCKDRKQETLEVISSSLDSDSGITFLIPILFHGRLLGLIAVSNSSTESSLDTQEIGFLRAISDQLAIALENDRIQLDEEKQRKQTETLQEVARILNNTQDPQRLLELILDQLDRVVAYDSASIMSIENGTISIVAHRKLRSKEQLQLPNKINAYPHIQEAIKTRKPVIIPDVNQDIRWIHNSHFHNIRCWMGVPLIGKDQVIGFLNLDSNKPGFYTQSDALLTITFANQAAIAIENAGLHTINLKRIDQMNALRETITDISTELELSRLLSAILERAISLLDGTGGDLGLFDAEKKEIEIVVSNNLGKDYVGTRMQVGEGAMGTVVDKLEPVIISDYNNWNKASHQYKDGPWYAVIAAPFLIGGRVVGAIGIVNSNPQQEFTQSDLNLLYLFAQNAAIAVENARLFQSKKEAADRRAVLYEVSQQIVRVSLDPTGIYEAIHNAATQLMPAEAFVIDQLDEITNTIKPIYLFDQGKRIDMEPFPANEGLSGLVISTGKSIYISDSTCDPLVESFFHFGEPNKVQSILAVPMRQRGKVVGMLSVQSYSPDVYTPEDQNLLEMLSTYAAIALDNAQLFMDIQELAITDSLTGIFNRRHLFEMGQREFIRAHRFDRPLSIIMIDIDNFKIVNDSFGHSVGDQILHELAQLMKAEVREIDIIGRYGGEEFTIILPETSLPKALEIAERIRKEVERIFQDADSYVFPITISLGVSELDSKCNSFYMLLNQADSALYAAKHAGKNQVKYNRSK